jgi:hypothetical protein
VSATLLVVVCNMNMTAKVVRNMVVRNMNLPITLNLITDHLRGLAPTLPVMIPMPLLVLLP